MHATTGNLIGWNRFKINGCVTYTASVRCSALNLNQHFVGRLAELRVAVLRARRRGVVVGIGYREGTYYEMRASGLLVAP